MVYGKLLFNNIKEYTPKWFKTVPYSQVTKPTFKRLPQRVGFLNRSPMVKCLWRGLRNTFGQYAWSWSLLIFGISFAWFHSIYWPYLAVYRYNNQNRTYAVAYSVQRAYKKKKQEEQRLAQQQQAAEEAARAAAQPQQVQQPVVQSQQVQSIAEQPVTKSTASSAQDQQQLAAAKKKQKLAALLQKILDQQEKKKANK